MASPSNASSGAGEANKATAVRFIQGFNNDDWDAVREVVAPGFVFHHPIGGTVEAGPEGMVSTWAGFKVLSPDSWHPIPVMIAEADEVAVLLPTYGTFTGRGEHAPPPTGGRLDYGMVNIVRFENGRLAEMWFGMDPLVEMQQMGVAPSPPPRVSDHARSSVATFESTVGAGQSSFDSVTGFDDIVVAMGPRQDQPETSTRSVDIYRVEDDAPRRIYHHDLVTNPPFRGGLDVDRERSRALVERWITDVLSGHGTEALNEIAGQHLLVHPTGMPCEAGYYGHAGVMEWLTEQWTAFSDLAVKEHHSVAQGDIVAVRWIATGTSNGEFMGLPATGEKIEFTGVTMYRIEDGCLAEIWDTRNTLGILGQLNPDIGAAGHHH